MEKLDGFVVYAALLLLLLIDVLLLRLRRSRVVDVSFHQFDRPINGVIVSFVYYFHLFFRTFDKLLYFSTRIVH